MMALGRTRISGPARRNPWPECCADDVLVAPTSRRPIPGRAPHGRTGAASQCSSYCRALRRLPLCSLPTLENECRLYCLAGGGPHCQGPGLKRSGPSRLKHVGLSIPWVLHFPIRLKLLAHSSSHEPLNLSCLASLKLHTVGWPAGCVPTDAEKKSLQCWLKQ